MICDGGNMGTGTTFKCKSRTRLKPEAPQLFARIPGSVPACSQGSAALCFVEDGSRGCFQLTPCWALTSPKAGAILGRLSRSYPLRTSLPSASQGLHQAASLFRLAQDELPTHSGI